MATNQETAAKPLIQAALGNLQRGDASGALAMLVQAEKKYSGSVGVKLNLALVRRTLADYPGALRALDSALAIDPYLFIALLSKGAVLEQMNEPRRAAEIYRNALRIAPSVDNRPPSLVEPIRHARELVEGLGGEILGYSFLVELDFLNGRAKLGDGARVESLIHY